MNLGSNAGIEMVESNVPRVLKDNWFIAVIVGIVIIIVVTIIVIPGISTADRAALVAAIVDVVLFIITVWLAHLTKKNVNAAADSVSATKNVVSATNKLIELQTEPIVFIGMRFERIVRTSRATPGTFPPEIELMVFIKNTGGSSALNIQFVDFKYYYIQSSIVKKGIKELAPGQEMPLTWFLRSQCSGFEADEVVFIYETLPGKLKLESNVLDFPSYMSSALPFL